MTMTWCENGLGMGIGERENVADTSRVKLRLIRVRISHFPPAPPHPRLPPDAMTSHAVMSFIKIFFRSMSQSVSHRL